MTDRETIDTYDRRAADYADMTDGNNAADPQLRAFLADMPPGGRILDLGCGPGASANAMADAGFRVDATDASAEMVALAGRHAGVTAYQADFNDIAGVAVYDGVWANFSLLHAPRDRMADHLTAIHRALKPAGLFHIGMKMGTDSARDSIGRLYTYYSDAELTAFLEQAGFTVTDRAFGQDIGLDGVMADWVCMIAHA